MSPFCVWGSAQRRALTPNTEASHAQVKNEAKTTNLPRSKDRAGAHKSAQNQKPGWSTTKLQKSKDRARAQQIFKNLKTGQEHKHLPKSKDRAGAQQIFRGRARCKLENVRSKTWDSFLLHAPAHMPSNQLNVRSAHPLAN